MICNDVFVVRSEEYWMDHKLLKAKVMLRGPPKQKKHVKRKRFTWIYFLFFKLFIQL